MPRASTSIEAPQGLSTEQVQAYRRDGALFPLRALDGDEVSRYRSAFRELAAHLPDPTNVSQLHLFFGWAYELATHPAIVGQVQAILGPGLLVKSTLVLAKPAHHPGRIPWHQDETKFSATDAAPQCAAWVALTDSSADNGCMRVLPGSHTQAMLPHGPFAGATLGVGAEEVQVEVDESQAWDLELAPGEMSLHHRQIIHGSNPNNSDRERIGFVIRYVADLTSWKLPVIAFGGRRPEGLEVLQRAPSYDLHQGLQVRREFLDERGVN